jgi:protein phosphatase
MGTTVTAILFAGDGDRGVGDRAVLMHVGDSRGYLFRDGVLTQLTKDDTYVQALVDQGVLTPDGARRHPQRALVTQAMQGQPLDPFVAPLEPRAGDLYLLCSDGLSDVVADDELARILAEATTGGPTTGDQPAGDAGGNQAGGDQAGGGDPSGLAGCARALVAAAVEGGAPDNVTVVLGALAAD